MLFINLHVVEAGEAHRVEAVLDAEGHAVGRVAQAATRIEQLEQHRTGRKDHKPEEVGLELLAYKVRIFWKGNA